MYINRYTFYYKLQDWLGGTTVSLSYLRSWVQPHPSTPPNYFSFKMKSVPHQPETKPK